MCEDERQALAENPLEVDDNLVDNDSAYAASEHSGSYQTSLTSSIINYKYVVLVFLEGSSNLLGETDTRMDAVTTLSELAPICWTPPNCAFEVDDFEADWLYTTPFDFIHARELEGCISDNDELCRRAFRHLAPGGYVEFQAANPRWMSDDGTVEKAESAQSWLKTLLEGSAKFGKSLEVAVEWRAKMEAAGFVDVQQEIRKMPIGAWPKDPKLKEMGRFQGIQQIQAVESYTPRLFSTVLGWTEEEIQVYIAKVRKDLQDPSIHLYLPIYFVWGRKPE
ncbi:hypothetical protein ACJ41O_005653 [Fusarium nematophilum]